MAIQIPDPGTGNGQTGDNEYVFRKKVKDNFSDQTNAASRLMGTEAGQIPLAEDTLKSGYGAGAITASAGFDFNDAIVGINYYVSGAISFVNQPVVGKEFLVFTQYSYLKTGKIQTAIEYSTGIKWVRTFINTWSVWRKVVLTNADGGISTTYTQAGIGAPKAAQKLLTATYTGGNISLPMGVTMSRVISATVMVDTTTGELIPSAYNVAGLKFNFFITGTNLSVRTSGEDSLLVGGTIKALINYEV